MNGLVSTGPPRQILRKDLTELLEAEHPLEGHRNVSRASMGSPERSGKFPECSRKVPVTPSKLLRCSATVQKRVLGFQHRRSVRPLCRIWRGGPATTNPFTRSICRGGEAPTNPFTPSCGKVQHIGQVDQIYHDLLYTIYILTCRCKMLGRIVQQYIFNRGSTC